MKQRTCEITPPDTITENEKISQHAFTRKANSALPQQVKPRFIRRNDPFKTLT